MLLLVCLGFCLGIQADNIVKIGNASGSPGEEVTVTVSMTNTDAVSALQLQVSMPDGISLIDGSAVLTDRGADHSATVGVKDGVLILMVYSLNMTALNDADGDVVSFRVKLGNQPGTFALNAQQVILTGTDGNAISGTSTNGNITVVAPKAQYNSMSVDFGHIPIRSTYTKSVTVTNVGNADLTVEGVEFSDVAFSSTTAFPLTIAPNGSAALNITYAPTERGTIEETMKVVCNSISKLNTIKLTADPFAVNELHVQNASGISDETVTVNLTMNNMDDITGFQWEFNLPSQLEYVDGSFQLSDRKEDHSFVATLKDGLLKVVCYSLTDTPFKGNDGNIASFDMIIRGRNNVTVTPSKAVLSAMVKGEVTDVLSASYGGTVTVRSPRLYTGNSMTMGATPVTSNAEKTFTVRNQGSAPLTISRVVFNNDHLSLKEGATLPLVIESNKTVTLTVVYDGTEEVAYDAIMQLYSNDPEQRVFNVKVTGSRFAPNYVSFVTNDINYGENLSVDMSINTYDQVEGFQFDVTYPAQFTVAEEAVVLGEAAQGMSVTHRAIDATTERFFCYFLSGTGIPAGENALMNILFSPKEAAVGGTYQVKISNIKLGTSELNDKYAGKEINTSFKVNKAPLTISGGTYTMKQGDPLPDLKAGYEGFKNGETEDVLTTKPTLTTTATSASEPGDYEVTVSGAAAQNYEITYVAGKITVTAADPVTVTAKNYTITYGEALPEFGYDVEGAELQGTPVITCEATSTSPVGTYPITVSKGDVTNYNVTYVAGTLTIEKAPLTISGGTYTMKQGEALPDLKAEYYGFKNGETEEVLTTKPTLTTTATSASEPGEYEVMASGAEAQNYVISYEAGKIAVTEADPVTVTAKSYTITYGEALPEFEYDVEGTELQGTPEITCEAAPTSPVGTYTITVSKGDITNYNVTYVAGTLTIEKAPLTITAKDFTRYIGEENPAFEAEYSGFKNSETSEVLSMQPSFTCEANAESEAGEYPIVVSGAEAQNYEITFVDGTLTVENYLLGDVNGDGKINVLDIVKIVSYIMGSPTQPFIEKAAHHNDDGVINVLDLVKEVSLVLAQGSTPSAGAKATKTQSTSTLPAVMITDEGQNKLSIGVDDSRQFIVTQFVMETTSGIKINDITSDDNHVVAYREVAENRYAVVCYSMTNAPFKSNNSIINVIYSGKGHITVSDAILVDEQENEVNFGSATSGLVTGINYLNAENMPVDIYTVGGKLVKKAATSTKGLPKGIYIVNGQKVTVK